MKQTIALLYDFDKTLCTTDMQNYSFIPNLGMTPGEFWGETDRFGRENGMDKILAYMYMMIKQSKDKNVKLTREYLNSLGKNIKYYNGVLTWFERINKYGEELGVNVEHYIISSGTKEIIEGSAIAKYFKEIYGCEFLYAENGEAMWPKVAINYTHKTQYIFRVSKGALDVTDDQLINTNISERNRHIRYTDMFYLGDGMTDIPCMQVLKDKGGKSIAVYSKQDYEKVASILNDKRVNFACVADYSPNSPLEKFVMSTMDLMVSMEKVRQKEIRQMQLLQNKFNLE